MGKFRDALHQTHLTPFGMKTLLVNSWKILAAVLLIYILSFIPNFLYGGYVILDSGDTRKLFGRPVPVAIPDSAIWMPYFGKMHIFKFYDGSARPRGDTIGYFYMPLILVGQAAIKPTVRFMDAEGFETREMLSLDLLRKHPRYY